MILTSRILAIMLDKMIVFYYIYGKEAITAAFFGGYHGIRISC